MLHDNQKAIEALAAFLRYKFPDYYNSPENYRLTVDLSMQDAEKGLEFVDRVLP